MQGSIAALYCTVLYCTVLYCTVPQCNVQYSIVQYRSESTGRHLLLSSAHPLQERFELHESLLVLRFTQLLHQSLGLLLEDTGSDTASGGSGEANLVTDDDGTVDAGPNQGLHKGVEVSLGGGG